MSPAVTALLQANPPALPSYSRQPGYCIDGHCGNYIFISHRFIEFLLCVKLYVGFMRNIEVNVTVLCPVELLRIGVQRGISYMYRWDSGMIRREGGTGHIKCWSLYKSS